MLETYERRNTGPKYLASFLAWAVLLNHAHLLLRTGTRPLAWCMRSLLTVYAGARRDALLADRPNDVLQFPGKSESRKVRTSEERGDMARKQATTKLVRLQAKGQITLPAEFRRRLNVDDDAILRVTLQEDGLTITPLRSERADPPLREYSQADIDRFLREDRLDKATAAKVRRLLSGKQAA